MTVPDGDFPITAQELFIVEGESAAKSVLALCNPDFQSVLPMQGKPINAMKAKKQKVLANPLFRSLLDILGVTPESPECDDSRFRRIILLFDPDADGIHCGALTLMFFYRLLLPILEGGLVFMARAPAARFVMQSPTSVSGNVIYAYSLDEARKLAIEMRREQFEFARHFYRGLASLEADILHATCLAPESRKLTALTAKDAEAAIAVFGGVGI